MTKILWNENLVKKNTIGKGTVKIFFEDYKLAFILKCKFDNDGMYAHINTKCHLMNQVHVHMYMYTSEPANICRWWRNCIKDN